MNSDILYSVASSLFFIWVVRNILFWVALWQLKEYRLDRIFVHLKETKQGRDLFFSPVSILKTFAIFAFGFVIFNNQFLLHYQIIVTIFYFFIAVYAVSEGLARTLKRPAITFKSILIVVASLLSVYLLYSLPIIDKFLWFLIIDRLTPFIVIFYILILSFPTEIIHDILIERAIGKIKKHRKLLVIGVTGSYGKSSTKEFIAQVLSYKFKVLKTKGTNNTPIGVAQTILCGLKKDTQIFVAEMGAYKKGEIEKLCNIVFPKIGVLTAVSNQHLSLFGSIENTMAAKYELIEALPASGLSIFNGNNQRSKLLFDKTEKRKVLYMTKNNSKEMLSSQRSEITAFNIKVKQESVSFDVLLGKNAVSFIAPLLGAHNVENILPAIYLAKKLGMKNDRIQNAVLALTPPKKTMKKYKLKNGANIIDDTFNASPQAVLAALDYLGTYRKKRILVLQPMIELGKNAKDDHFAIGKEASLVCDSVILTNSNYYSEVKKGVKVGNSECSVVIANSETPHILKNTLENGDTIIFEGKESGSILNQII